MDGAADKRIHAIDAVRGFCLLNIVVNHFTLGMLHELSPSKIAFCDAADIFVFLAGISAFLAYGGRETMPEKMWSRAARLYAFNLTLIAATLPILALAAWAIPGSPPKYDPVGLAQAHGLLDWLWNVVTLQQSVGFSMVLRLYVFLMVVGPVYLWLAARRWWLPLPPAALVWLVAGHLKIVSTDSLTGDWLSMSLLPWNLVFASGIALGAAIKAGVPLPRSPALRVGAAAFVIGGSLLLVAGPRIAPEIAPWLETRNDHFWTGISKSLQSPLRLAYVWALAYCVMAFPRAPLVRLLHSVKAGNPLCRLGRRSLEVFTFGAVAAVAGEVILFALIVEGLVVGGSPAALAAELALVLPVLGGMLWIADLGRPAPGRMPREPARVSQGRW